MIDVAAGMSVPTLGAVVEALQLCQATRVHERTLEMLNLFYLELFPRHFIESSAVHFQSVAAKWIGCTLNVLEGIK